jgi:hypothetical protein
VAPGGETRATGAPQSLPARPLGPAAEPQPPPRQRGPAGQQQRLGLPTASDCWGGGASRGRGGHAFDGCLGSSQDGDPAQERRHYERATVGRAREIRSAAIGALRDAVPYIQYLVRGPEVLAEVQRSPSRTHPPTGLLDGGLAGSRDGPEGRAPVPCSPAGRYYVGGAVTYQPVPKSSTVLSRCGR